MEQKKKFVNQVVELERLNKECEAVLAAAARLDMGVPIERQQCRDSMKALRTLLGNMRMMSLQVEMYIAEYSDLTAASNDNIK
ncbi:hypothetical protein RJO15_11870 [Herbaspirillum huttiense F1]|uniref:hypothetical protein n=1 Tax=Herbaspirillum huttiense TaxID=863372 RepID=UPI0028871900|nr:hypothetical protein [Herbaspirillum huttiense]MDT0356472.1 hypothetical protein [Herbaspirillum huttiense F1]